MYTDPREQIIWSADVADEAALMAALDLMPELQIIKIDRLFLEGRSLDIIQRLQMLGYQVFDDAKIWEIPSKSLGIAEKHLKQQPWMLNCSADILSTGLAEHENADKIDGLQRFAYACHKVGTRPCGVTVLTTKTPEIAEQEFGKSSIEQVLYYADKLVEFNFTDIVCSPLEVPVLRSERRFDNLDINTPGVRPLWAVKGDQARVSTPTTALQAGANRLVIGRPITDGVPAENLTRIFDEIEAIA